MPHVLQRPDKRGHKHQAKNNIPSVHLKQLSGVFSGSFQVFLVGAAFSRTPDERERPVGVESGTLETAQNFNLFLLQTLSDALRVIPKPSATGTDEKDFLSGPELRVRRKLLDAFVHTLVVSAGRKANQVIAGEVYVLMLREVDKVGGENIRHRLNDLLRVPVMHGDVKNRCLHDCDYGFGPMDCTSVTT